MLKSLLPTVAKALTTAVTLSVALVVDAPQAKAASLLEKDLFFGRNIAGDGEVSSEEFEEFADSAITTRFPAGTTTFNADGQFLDSTGTIIEEQSKVVTLFVEDTPESEIATKEIVTEYQRQFNQESVLQVTNKDELKVGFGAGENLIDNDPTPEFIQGDLFFGRDIAGNGEVSEEQFQAFVDSVVTPRFPDGLTIFDAEGQFLDSTDTIIEEQSKVVTLLFEDTRENEIAIDEIIEEYIQQFNQESVLLVIDEDVQVAFDASSTTPVPEPASTLGLLIFGSLGASFVLKRKMSLVSSLPSRAIDNES